MNSPYLPDPEYQRGWDDCWVAYGPRGPGLGGLIIGVIAGAGAVLLILRLLGRI